MGVCLLSAWGTTAPGEPMNHYAKASAPTTYRHAVSRSVVSPLPAIALSRYTTGAHEYHPGVGKCPTSQTPLPSSA